MAIKTKIEDGRGNNYVAKVTNRGQLVTSPLDFSEPETVVLDIVDTAYNFFLPITNNRFVITDIIASGNKNIGPDGSIVTVYSGDTEDDLTGTKDTFEFEIYKAQVIPLTGLNIITPEGAFINAKCTDDDVYLTIAGYYIDA